MTQQPDWKAEREAISARLNKADRQRFTASHSNYPTWDEVRRLLDRDLENEREKAEFDQLFAAWQDRLWVASGKIKGDPDLGMETIVQIIEKRLADAAVTSEFASHLVETLSTRATREVEMIAEVEAHFTAELALREQRISELEQRVSEAFDAFTADNDRARKAEREVERLRKANEEILDATWAVAVGVAEYQFDTTGSGSMMLASMRKAHEIAIAARQSREDESK